MSRIALTLDLLPGELAVCRLGPDAGVPDWASAPGPVRAVIRTARELTLVCAAAQVPGSIRAERGFRVLQVEGPLDFCLTGILAALAVPLAEAGVSLFALSTFDTDCLMVRDDQLGQAQAALEAAGHHLRGVC